MSEKKSTNNIANLKEIEDDQSHSDSDETIDGKSTGLIIKSEKKKQIQNFGRPRKHPYKPGKYKCMYCETMCSKPSVLTKHLRAHTNERPFPCGLCKRSFKTKSNLSKHEKSKSHSSKLEESGISTISKQSKREQAEIMLQAMSKSESFLKIPEPMTNIEFDSIGRKTSVIESNCSSPLSSDRNSDISEEQSISEVVKKEKSEKVEIADNNEDIPDKVDSSSSCSGVLTINSQGGPITVEVQINLETMRHLQQGLSNMTSKRNSPLSPASQPTQRNDAELRAAESILHMANQRPHIPELVSSKDDYRKNGTTFKKLPDTLSPQHNKSPEMTNMYKSINITKPIPSNSNSNRSTPLDEYDPTNSKSNTKCLVKENLLKKMKRKVQEINGLSVTTDLLTVNNAVTMSHNGMVSNTKPVSEKTSESVMSFTVTRPSNFQQPLKNEMVYKNLISDSKSASLLSLKSNKLEIYNKSRMLSSNTQILNSLSTPSNSPTIVVLTPTNNFSKTLLSDSKSVTDISLVSISESNKSNLAFDTATLSKVITNTQSLHQHQGNKTSNMDNLSVTNSITTSRVAISSSCINSNKSITSENIKDKVKDDRLIDENKFDKPTCVKQLSVQTTQESENELSPRLCIVEDTSNLESCNFDKKSSESDEEIDVVNTDSDDDRLPLQRVSEVSYSAESTSKRRKIGCDDENDTSQIDGKRIKEVEKCVHLHAPNINAKDLMQDCPLNLSANRQPTIPPVSQIPDISVLQNLYQSISPSSVNISSSNSTNVQESNLPINVLTNHNPAHPQSFQNFTSSSSLPNNDHHRDYPIFEDKIPCEVCGQLLDPSMLNLHKNMHIYTNSKDSHLHVNNNTKLGSSVSVLSSSTSLPPKISFNKPRSYKCVVCNIAFRVIGHLRKHHKSKSHLQGLVNSGLLSKSLFSKIEQSKVPIQEVIDQKTGNIIPDVLSRYISNWSQANTDCDPQFN